MRFFSCVNPVSCCLTACIHQPKQSGGFRWFPASLTHWIPTSNPPKALEILDLCNCHLGRAAAAELANVLRPRPASLQPLSLKALHLDRYLVKRSTVTILVVILSMLGGMGGRSKIYPGWWFQIYFYFHPIPGEMIRFDAYFSKWVETTNYSKLVVWEGCFLLVGSIYFGSILVLCSKHV